MEHLEKMKTLRLNGMYQMWQSLTETRRHLELDLQEGLKLLLQAEEENRQTKRLERLRKAAGFRYQASLEEIDFNPKIGLEFNNDGFHLNLFGMLRKFFCSFLKLHL